MKLRRHRHVFGSAALVSAALAAGCGDAAPVGMSPVEQAVTAAGGKDALIGIKSEVIVSTGQRFEPGQALSPSAAPVALGDFNYTVNHDVAGDRMAVQWKRGSLVGVPLTYNEVIGGDLGYADGRDGAFAMVDKAALLSGRVAAVRKHQRLFKPHLLLRKALDKPETVTMLPAEAVNGAMHHVVAIADKFQPIHLYIDQKTGLVSKVTTQEDDPMRGDVTIDIAFSDYKVVSGVTLPHALTLSLGGVRLHSETRSAITLNTPPADTVYALPDMYKGMFDAADASRGEAISEYLHRFAAIGFPADFDSSRSVQAQVLVAGVVHITGAGAHTLAVDLGDSVAAIEAPNDDARSKVVIAEIKRQFPGKPIKYIINTHHHDDHSGGVRTYVAEGATLVTAAGNEAYFKTVLTARHMLRPDALQMKGGGAQAQITTVGSTMVELGTTRKIRVYPIANPHADGMLGVYVVDTKHFFVADLFSPGFFPANAKIDGFFGEGAKALYTAIVTTHKLDVTAIVGAHGVGTALLATLKINAGL